MKLTRKAVDSVDFEKLRAVVGPSEWFYEKPGKEPHRLLAYLSTLFHGKTIFDIGTHLGDSALALSYNPENHVESFDILDKVSPARKTCGNVSWHLGDLLSPEFRATWARKLLDSPLIYLDVDPHHGVQEFELVQWLRENHYKGLIVLDDIWYFKPMRNNLWYRIEGKYKADATSIGHWSGTGIVSFREPIEIEGLVDTSNWTLVTGYFDLTVMPDANPAIKARPPSLYLDEHAASTLTLEQNLLVFCEPKFADKILAIRPKHLHPRTKIVQMTFDDFPLTRYRDQIISNRGGQSGCPSDPRNTASYYLFCMSRYAMLRRAIAENPFGSTHFAWVNICIERMGYQNLAHLHEALSVQREKFSTCWIEYVPQKTTQSLADNFGPRCVGRTSMCSGFFTGSAKYMQQVCERIEKLFLTCLEAGYGHADEQLMYLAYWEDPTLFDWYVGDYQQMVTNYAAVYDRPERPLHHLIRHSLEARDFFVCAQAIDQLTKSIEAGTCTLGPDDTRLLAATRKSLGDQLAALMAGSVQASPPTPCIDLGPSGPTYAVTSE